MHNDLAKQFINALDNVIMQPSLLKTPEAIFAAYNHVISIYGDNLDSLLRDKLDTIYRKENF